MAYKVRAHKTDEGGYTLEYGKGNKKLVHRLVKHGNAWRFIEAPSALLGKFALMDNAKQAFETWAGKVYGGDTEETNMLTGHSHEITAKLEKGTILDRSKVELKYGPPPPMTSGGPYPDDDDPREGPPAQPGMLNQNTDFQGDYDTPDPLDPDNYFKGPDGHVHITRLGALRHVWQWVYNRYVMSSKHDEIPAPFESVRRVLAHEDPTNLDYQPYTPAKAK